MKCRNCEQEFENTKNYCPDCGARVIRNRLTAKALTTQFSEEFLSYDNKILKTFIDLFKTPEKVINSYINGTRKKYIGVAQYFAISLSLVGLQVFLMNTIFKDALNIDLPFMDVTKGTSSGAKNPINDLNLTLASFNNYQSIFYVISVPFSALSTWLGSIILSDKRFNFPEHLVLNIYYSAQIIIVSAIITIICFSFGISYITVSTLVSILNFAYFFFILKRVFTDTKFKALARFLLAMVITGFCFLFIMIIVAVIVFSYGYMQTTS